MRIKKADLRAMLNDAKALYHRASSVQDKYQAMLLMDDLVERINKKKRRRSIS